MKINPSTIHNVGEGRPLYAAYTHRSGRVAEIEYVANDDCRQIDTRQRYTLILLEAGSLTLDVGGHIRAFAAPCVLPVQENLEITFVRSHRLAARVIRFDVSFLNVHIGYEMIHSGRYEESIEDFGFIPLNAFYECPDGVPPFLPLSRDGFLRMQDLFDAFGTALASRNDPRWSCWTRLHLLMILELVHRCHTAAVGQRTAGFDLQAPHVWVSLLLEYIHSHYAESLSLDALSQYIHVNKTSLTKEFKAVVGCSVSEYIQLYRFQCACLALSTTDIPVGDIAGQCGFSSGAYFARRFRQVMGMTPLEYRKSRIHNRTAAGGNPPA